MSIKVNVTGAVKNVGSVYANKGGAVKTVRQGYVKKAGAWQQIFGNNLWQFYALGTNQNLYAGGNTQSVLLNNSVYSFVSERSYNLALFDEYGNLSSIQTYDVWNATTIGGNTSNPAGAIAFDNAINALPTGQAYCIFTYDDAYFGTDYGSIAADMATLGAQAFRVGFHYRGAYLLIGNARQSVAFEGYAGSDVGEDTTGGAGGPTDAMVTQKFTIQNNVITLIA